MAGDPNKEKGQQTAEGYSHDEEVKAINDRYDKASKGLSESYDKQERAVSEAYDTQIGGYDTFLGEVGKKQEELGIKSEEQEKRANAFRYIAGIGDAISGVANLVGTAHGAVNQNQYYNAPEIIQKAEASRAERKLEMDKLNARMDELRAQRSVLESTKGMKLGELEGKKASELLGLELQKGKDIAAADAMAREEGWRQKQFDESVRQHNEDKEFKEAQQKEQARQFNVTNTRLTEQAEADRQTRKEIAEANNQARIDAVKAKGKTDPKHQARVLQQSLVGVRDELARKMGYKDYNEYLRYQSGGAVDEVSKREAKKTRKERESKNPEVVEFLTMLQFPEDLTDAQLSSLMGASTVFADAVDKASVASEELNPANDPNL